MPVWHNATRQWVKEGRLVLLGIVQEQHADRSRLFAQWKRFDWPILHDPINIMETAGVPILVAIDEHGIVRSTQPRPETFEEDFLNKEFADDAPDDSSGSQNPALKPGSSPPDFQESRNQAEAAGSAEAWRHLGDALALWGGPTQIDQAIDAYRHAIELDPEDGNSLFRLGVCYRMRHDSDHRQNGDFQEAVDYWQKALATNPNQYIWRRRIQQYGPRLDKPYPFYDWVRQAVDEISARGEESVSLAVAPSGAEIAHPSHRFSIGKEAVQAPDPNGKIRRDTEDLIATEVTVVPSPVRAGQTTRVHVAFLPNDQRKVHWSNDVGPLQLWVEPPPGWKVSQQWLTAPLGNKPETNEDRLLEFEVQVPESASGPGQLKTYALYYVCEDVGGTCQFLRRDIEVAIPIEN